MRRRHSVTREVAQRSGAARILGEREERSTDAPADRRVQASQIALSGVGEFDAPGRRGHESGGIAKRVGHEVAAHVQESQRLAGLFLGERLDAFAQLLLGGHDPTQA